MSWASHDLEPYVIQRFMGRRVMFVPLLLGSYIARPRDEVGRLRDPRLRLSRRSR